MAKKRIDNIAKHRQQPRGPPPRRRTDFSIFLCSSSYSEATSDAPPGSSHARDGLPNVATTRLNKVNDIGKEPGRSTLIPCSDQLDTRTQLSDGHLTRIDPDEQTDHPFSDRDVTMRSQEHDTPRTSESPVTGSSDGCITPCFDERDENLSDGFQDLSKQASNGKDLAGSRRQLFKSSDRKKLPDHQQQQSSGGLTLSNSTELEDESSERGRGKRKRKPKVHFDEESNLSLKSAGKVRRFRIMRYLGLMAPLGSPFSRLHLS